MRISESVFCYEGDRVEYSRHGYFSHYPGIGSSNFLVIQGDVQLMIDSGMSKGPHRRRLQAEQSSDGVDLNESAVIVFSHAHPDHTMMAKELAKKGEGIAFLMHEDNEKLTRNPDFLFEYYFNYPDWFRSELFVFPGVLIKNHLRTLGLSFDYIKVDNFFSDKMPNDFGCGIMKPLALYGHCQGHCGFHLPNEGIVYSGDLFDLRCSPGASLLSSDSSWALSVANLQSLLKLDIGTLVPGHGCPVLGVTAIRETLNRVLEETYMYKPAVLDCLKKLGRPSSISELHSRLYPDSIAYNAFSRKITIYNILKELKSDGLVDVQVRRHKGLWQA